MRTLALCAIGALCIGAEPVSDERAKEALARFQVAFKAPGVEAKQAAVYTLHDVPHDLVLKELDKLLRNRDAGIRNVAALAMGGQRHDAKKAGDLLMKAYRKERQAEEVVASVFEAMAELDYTGYWPDVKGALKDERNVVVVSALDLLGTTADWRAFPDLVELYREIMPRRVNWTTGAVVLPDGTDQEAKAQWEAKYGVGGSKEKAKAKAKANSFDLRNFSPQIRACVKRITGKDFENAFDLEEWWCENYIEVARKIAEFEGKDPDSVVPRAKLERAKLKAKVEEERRKLDEELAEGK